MWKESTPLRKTDSGQAALTVKDPEQASRRALSSSIRTLDSKPQSDRLLACQIWREADPEDARLLKAAIAWELASGRRAMSIDEAEVRERRAAKDEGRLRRRPTRQVRHAERQDALPSSCRPS